MVSKHSAVRSIRLQNTDWEWLSEEAEKRGTTVNGLVAEGVALMRAPQPSAQWSEEDVAKMTAKPRPPLVINRIQPAAHVAVPLHKPKAFNPQPKKGKK